MISCISCSNIHEFGKAYESQFKLRYGEFVARQSYNVPHYEGMEFDKYDTPASRYLIYHTDDGTALGVSRLTPTTVSCMLKDLWPQLVDDKSQLQSETVWEGTRYAVDKSVTPELRDRIIDEMALAYLEFGLRHGLTKIIGLMPTYIYRSVFVKRGIQMDELGPIEKIDGQRCRAVAIPVSVAQLNSARRNTGIFQPVLRFSLQEGVPAYAEAA
jgi:N-acyl-L-homoserine lactone synthetase